MLRWKYDRDRLPLADFQERQQQHQHAAPPRQRDASLAVLAHEQQRLDLAGEGVWRRGPVRSRLDPDMLGPDGEAGWLGDDRLRAIDRGSADHDVTAAVQLDRHLAAPV